MTMSREFRETVAVRVREDPAYVQTLLDEAVQLFVGGEPETARLVLRDLVNVTVGFESLAADVRKPAKSLHRMLSASGNPTMSNLSAIFAALQRSLRLDVRTEVVRLRASRPRSISVRSAATRTANRRASGP